MAAYSGRNILIDGEVGRINQSGFDGNWANVVDWEYGYDIWRKTNDGDIFQVVEKGNFKPNSVYTLSGNGVTTRQVTSPSSGNWEWGTSVPNTATNVQLELGTVATEFEILPYSDQLARVQRHYVKYGGNATYLYPTIGVDSSGRTYEIEYPVTMRDVPAVTIETNVGNPTLTISNNRCRVVATANTPGSAVYIQGNRIFDARI